MYQGCTVAVVVPAYNEESPIGRVIESMPEFVDRILIIDDTSSDATAEVGRHYLPELNERLMLVEHETNYWHVADSQSGYTAINPRALKTIDWDLMYKRYGQPNDLLVRLNVYDLRVRDVLVRPVHNVGEESGIKPLRMIPKLFRFWRTRPTPFPARVSDRELVSVELSLQG